MTKRHQKNSHHQLESYVDHRKLYRNDSLLRKIKWLACWIQLRNREASTPKLLFLFCRQNNANIDIINHSSTKLRYVRWAESLGLSFISITSPISSCVTNKGTQILLLLPKRLLWEMQPIFSGENMFNHLYHHTLSYITMFMQYAYVYLLGILSVILTMKMYVLFLLP